MATVTVRAYYEDYTQLATCDLTLSDTSNYTVSGIYGAFVNATGFEPETEYSRTAGSNLARVNYVSKSTYASTADPTSNTDAIGFKASGTGWFSFYYENPVQTYDINVKAYQWNNSSSDWTLLESYTIEDVSEGNYTVFGVYGAFVNATGFEPPSAHIATTGTDYTGTTRVDPDEDENTITVDGGDSYCYFYYEASVSSHKVHIYNGSNWIEATPYIYNGRSWVEASEYIYDGGWQ